MKASDILKDALQSRGISQKEFASVVGVSPNTLSSKMKANTFKAQEMIEYINELGYEIKLVDRLAEEKIISIRRRSTSPRAKAMIENVIYDTAKADAICHTDVENGCYTELFMDSQGRFFTVTYSCWPGEKFTISVCTRDRAESLYRSYADSRTAEYEEMFEEKTGTEVYSTPSAE